MTAFQPKLSPKCQFEVKEVSAELIVFHRGVGESGWFLES